MKNQTKKIIIVSASIAVLILCCIGVSFLYNSPSKIESEKETVTAETYEFDALPAATPASETTRIASEKAETPTPTETPEPTPTATPEPTPIATPEPTPIATPEPTPIATPEPTPIATPEPTAPAEAPEAVPDTGDSTYQQVPADGNYFYNDQNYAYDINTVSVKPGYVRFEGDKLIATCFVINGYSKPVYNVQVTELTFGNSDGIICSAAFSGLDGVVIPAYSWVTCDFTFDSTLINMMNADLSTLAYQSRTSCNY